jgi:TonB family protein
MPHALLLSPDDQAVSAITGVLEEMSVTCERPLDGLSAAQKLNSRSFDLVLVDCENLPAAKLIFDVCRRGKDGSNPVPIAIVDGRAGLPTAFRLGAELILTKPVAKDQARSTIRTAVSRVRKDAPAIENTQAAAAAAGTSTLLTSYTDPIPSAVPSSAPGVTPPAALAATAAAPALAKETIPSLETAPGAAVSNSDPALIPAPTPLKSKLPTKLSDDPVLAELERAELEEAARTEAAKTNASPAAAVVNVPAMGTDAPFFSAYPQSRQKPRGGLVALLVMMLAGGGFYAAWMYQPGFRTLAQPQIDRLLTLAGMALPPVHPPAQAPAKPVVQPTSAPAVTQTPAVDADKTVVGADSANAPDTAAVASATGSPATSVPGSAPVQAAATPVAVAAPAAPTPAAKTPVAVNKPEAVKASVNKLADTKKVEAAVSAAEAPLPGESSAIILSSKGAEKRLAHSVSPKYPADARSNGAEGTVVLKEVVDENGRVEGVRLVEGNPTLAPAAIQAVKQWRYRPYVRDGKAQPFQTVVIIDFQKP